MHGPLCRPALHCPPGRSGGRQPAKPSPDGLLLLVVVGVVGVHRWPAGRPAGSWQGMVQDNLQPPAQAHSGAFTTHHYATNTRGGGCPTASLDADPPHHEPLLPCAPTRPATHLATTRHAMKAAMRPATRRQPTTSSAMCHPSSCDPEEPFTWAPRPARTRTRTHTRTCAHGRTHATKRQGGRSGGGERRGGPGSARNHPPTPPTHHPWLRAAHGGGGCFKPYKPCPATRPCGMT